MSKPDLAPNEHEALRCFVEYLQSSLANRLVTVALFGSKARGDSRPDSDLDVLVIIQEDDRELRRDILTQAARISLEFDLILSPRVIGAPRWEQMRDFSLYLNVVREASEMRLRGEDLVLETEGVP